MDKAQVLKLIQTGDAAIKQAGLYETQLAAIEDARTKQAAEVSAAIPTAIDAMLAAKLIEPHEKAAAVAAISDHVACIETLTNFLTHNVKQAAATLGGPAGGLPTPPEPMLESDRVWRDGVRKLRQ